MHRNELASFEILVYIFSGYVVVLDRPAFDLYITYSVYCGTIPSHVEFDALPSIDETDEIVPRSSLKKRTIKGRSVSIVTGPG